MARKVKKPVVKIEPGPDLMGELFANGDAVFAMMTRAGTPRKRAQGAGRKIEGPERAAQASYRLYPTQHTWLKAQPGGGSAKLRELVARAMEAEHAADLD